MTGTNHILTGALVGLTVANPFIAVPAAFLSHFACDMVPHFGHDDSFMLTKKFKALLMIEATIMASILALVLLIQPANWHVVVFCGFAAFAPDLIWLRKFAELRRGGVFKPHWFERMSHDIQWFQRPVGAFVELFWFGAAVTLFLNIL